MATESITKSNVSISVQRTVEVEKVFMIRSAYAPSAIIASQESPFSDEGRSDARIIVEWMGDYLPAYTFDEVVRLLQAVKVP